MTGQLPLSAVAEGARFGLRAWLLAARFLAPKRLIIQVRRTVYAASSRRSTVSRGGAAGAGGQVCGFASYETRGRMQISPLFAWRSGAREEFEVKDA